MKAIIVLFLAVFFSAMCANASWYWPFGDDEEKPPRLSELMEKASILIDEASDLNEEGKVDESVAKYREALKELDRVEAENPERAETTEFATLRNKRAYINAAIDSILLSQAIDNAKSVAITDTAELEKRLSEEKARKSGRGSQSKEKEPEIKEKDAEESAVVEKRGETVENAAKARVAKRREEAKTRERKVTITVQNTAKKNEIASERTANDGGAASGKAARLKLAQNDLKSKDYDAAMLTVRELLDERPNDVAALNLKAAIESARGESDAAQMTLMQAINSHPRSHYAYYNLAKLILRVRLDNDGIEAARRYYETGRKYANGPEDAYLERKLK